MKSRRGNYKSSELQNVTALVVLNWRRGNKESSHSLTANAAILKEITPYPEFIHSIYCIEQWCWWCVGRYTSVALFNFKKKWVNYLVVKRNFGSVVRGRWLLRWVVNFKLLENFVEILFSQPTLYYSPLSLLEHSGDVFYWFFMCLAKPREGGWRDRRKPGRPLGAPCWLAWQRAALLHTEQCDHLLFVSGTEYRPPRNCRCMFYSPTLIWARWRNYKKGDNKKAKEQTSKAVGVRARTSRQDLESHDCWKVFQNLSHLGSTDILGLTFWDGCIRHFWYSDI